MQSFCLIVDDSPLYLDAVSSLVQSCFPELPIQVARDGSSALSLAQQPTCGLLLLDYQLPGLNGGDVIRHLRAAAERTLADTPQIVLMSTQPDVAVFARSLRVAFLPKPVLEADLLQVLRPLVATMPVPTTPRRLWRIQPRARQVGDS